jgi:hypothetical protein
MKTNVVYGRNRYFYWLIKRKQQPNIEINTLYEFFKDLNTKGPDEQQSTTLQNELPNNSNVHVTPFSSSIMISYSVIQLITSLRFSICLSGKFTVLVKARFWILIIFILVNLRARWTTVNDTTKWTSK